MTSPAAPRTGARPGTPQAARPHDRPAARAAGRVTAPPEGGPADRPALIEGVDLDAVAAAVRACPSVDDLCAGSWGGVVSYFAGRQVAGIRVSPDHVLISVRARWGVPVVELAGEVRGAVASLVAPRRVDIVVADLAEAPARAVARAVDEPGAVAAGAGAGRELRSGAGA